MGQVKFLLVDIVSLCYHRVEITKVYGHREMSLLLILPDAAILDLVKSKMVVPIYMRFGSHHLGSLKIISIRGWCQVRRLQGSHDLGKFGNYCHWGKRMEFTKCCQMQYLGYILQMRTWYSPTGPWGPGEPIIPEKKRMQIFRNYVTERQTYYAMGLPTAV